MKMKLKTALLIAIVGQVLTFAFYTCFNFLRLFDVLSFGRMESNVIFTLIGIMNTGTLVLFLVTFYAKQK